MTPLKAIREKCIDCMCGSMTEVRLCTCESCSLYPYRFGHNPSRQGIGGRVFNTWISNSSGDFEYISANEGVSNIND